MQSISWPAKHSTKARFPAKVQRRKGRQRRERLVDLTFSGILCVFAPLRENSTVNSRPQEIDYHSLAQRPCARAQRDDAERWRRYLQHCCACKDDLRA